MLSVLSDDDDREGGGGIEGEGEAGVEKNAFVD
jgi:hypothetical protein